MTSKPNSHLLVRIALAPQIDGILERVSDQSPVRGIPDFQRDGVRDTMIV